MSALNDKATRATVLPEEHRDNIRQLTHPLAQHSVLAGTLGQPGAVTWRLIPRGEIVASGRKNSSRASLFFMAGSTYCSTPSFSRSYTNVPRGAIGAQQFRKQSWKERLSTFISLMPRREVHETACDLCFSDSLKKKISMFSV